MEVVEDWKTVEQVSAAVNKPLEAIAAASKADTPEEAGTNAGAAIATPWPSDKTNVSSHMAARLPQSLRIAPNILNPPNPIKFRTSNTRVLHIVNLK
ncbi:hypothetical protein [Magnetovibrio blakemorei]|uniref:hypothetical protein n=1 Tax=Magnetovibrio blakemorei TaxID=28181 RepID=UPI001112D798|nr:hypothetical protein [Magnetovibrio blakemorei]